MQTVAELPEFIRGAAALLTDAERLDLIRYLAENPRAGAVMQGTGGVRKLRWGLAGRGKRSGVRIIYYVYDEAMPLYLLTLFAKNERANLSQTERNELAGLVDLLVQAWRRSSK
jgi:hypothetical protein